MQVRRAVDRRILRRCRADELRANRQRTERSHGRFDRTNAQRVARQSRLPEIIKVAIGFRQQLDVARAVARSALHNAEIAAKRSEDAFVVIPQPIPGTFLEQAEKWAPDVIETLQRLVKSGRVEIVAETYYHSMSFFYDRAEFEAQVKMHKEKIMEILSTITPEFMKGGDRRIKYTFCGNYGRYV